MAASSLYRTTMENLPSDVLSNILIRLLAKQLAQMRCLSKSFNALLSHPSFVKSHLHRSIQNNDEILLFFDFGLLFMDGAFSINSKPLTARSSRAPHLLLTNFIELPLTFKYELPSEEEVIGSVNGLICFTYRNFVSNYYSVCIWNPSLSAMLNLSTYLLPDDYFDVFKVDLQFGFDPKTDDYKVVKITSTVRQTFCEIPVPDSTRDFNGDHKSKGLGRLGGNICLISIVGVAECEIWKMEEYRVAESWVKHHVVSHFCDKLIPYGITLHNELLFEALRHSEDGIQSYLALYDLISGKTKKFKYITGYKREKSKVVEYVDSLVWVASALDPKSEGHTH